MTCCWVGGEGRKATGSNVFSREPLRLLCGQVTGDRWPLRVMCFSLFVFWLLLQDFIRLSQWYSIQLRAAFMTSSGREMFALWLPSDECRKLYSYNCLVLSRLPPGDFNNAGRGYSWCAAIDVIRPLTRLESHDFLTGHRLSEVQPQKAVPVWLCLAHSLPFFILT